MKFSINSKKQPEYIVDLTLQEEKDGRIFLYANDKPIMCFQEGMFCRYSSANSVPGLIATPGVVDLIKESDKVF